MMADLQGEASKDLEGKSSKSTGAPVNDEVCLSDIQLSLVSQLEFAQAFLIAQKH